MKRRFSLKPLCALLLKFFGKLRRTFISKNFIEFCLLGCFNCFNDGLFSWLAEYFMQKNIAQIFGYFCGLTIAFFVTCKLIFKSAPTLEKYIKFLISYIPNFIIYFLVGFITLNTLKLNQFMGTFLAAMAGGPITYVFIKIYAFGNPKYPTPPEERIE